MPYCHGYVTAASLLSLTGSVVSLKEIRKSCCGWWTGSACRLFAKSCGGWCMTSACREIAVKQPTRPTLRPFAPRQVQRAGSGRSENAGPRHASLVDVNSDKESQPDTTHPTARKRRAVVGRVKVRRRRKRDGVYEDVVLYCPMIEKGVRSSPRSPHAPPAARAHARSTVIGGLWPGAGRERRGAVCAPRGVAVKRP